MNNLNTKKKVSFDIDAKILSSVKSFCSSKNKKLADFYREAVEEKLKNDLSFLEVFLCSQKGIKKINIPVVSDMEYNIYTATEEMKINVNAVKEGVIYNIDSIEDEILRDVLLKYSKNNTVHFFTKK